VSLHLSGLSLLCSRLEWFSLESPVPLRMPRLVFEVFSFSRSEPGLSCFLIFLRTIFVSLTQAFLQLWTSKADRSFLLLLEAFFPSICVGPLLRHDLKLPTLPPGSVSCLFSPPAQTLTLALCYPRSYSITSTIFSVARMLGPLNSELRLYLRSFCTF